MFHILRQLAKFWTVLMLAAVAAYLLIFNQERIFIQLPGIGQFHVTAALAFIIAFALGATVVTFYFAADILRKSWEIKRLNKRISLLERKLSELGSFGDGTQSKKSWFGKRDNSTPSQPEHVPIINDQEFT